MQEVEFGEKLECEGSTVCGMDTGRVIAKFSHEAEAESFVDAYNSQSKLSDLEIVQKAVIEKCGRAGCVVFHTGGWVVETDEYVIAEGNNNESLLTWAKQTIEGVE